MSDLDLAEGERELGEDSPRSEEEEPNTQDREFIASETEPETELLDGDSTDEVLMTPSKVQDLAVKDLGSFATPVAPDHPADPPATPLRRRNSKRALSFGRESPLPSVASSKRVKRSKQAKKETIEISSSSEEEEPTFRPCGTTYEVVKSFFTLCGAARDPVIARSIADAVRCVKLGL